MDYITFFKFKIWVNFKFFNLYICVNVVLLLVIFYLITLYIDLENTLFLFILT